MLVSVSLHLARWLRVTCGVLGASSLASPLAPSPGHGTGPGPRLGPHPPVGGTGESEGPAGRQPCLPLQVRARGRHPLLSTRAHCRCGSLTRLSSPPTQGRRGAVCPDPENHRLQLQRLRAVGPGNGAVHNPDVHRPQPCAELPDETRGRQWHPWGRHRVCVRACVHACARVGICIVSSIRGLTVSEETCP